jgi:hypothetical protein
MKYTFPDASPYNKAQTEMIYDLVQVEVQMCQCLGTTRAILYLDQTWGTLGYEAFGIDGDLPFEVWFPSLFASEFSRWRKASVVIYVERLAENLVFHFIVTPDLPVCALEVDVNSGNAEWIDPMGPIAGVLSAAMAEAKRN